MELFVVNEGSTSKKKKKSMSSLKKNIVEET